MNFRVTAHYGSLLGASLCGLLACGGSQEAEQTPESAVSLAIIGPTIVDVRTGRLSKSTILISENQIRAILDPNTDEVPNEARVIDARGKYVIPGLWDLHTHIQTQEELDLFVPLLIAHGVLGIRDAGGLMPEEFQEGLSRHQYAPRVIASGPIVDGPAPESEEPAAIVDALASQSVDYIKIHSLVPRERLVAIVERADELGSHAAGHVPVAMSAGDASDVGLRTMEHFLEVHLSVSAREQTLRQDRLATVGGGFSSLGELIRLLAYPPPDPLLKDWSDQKASALFNLLATNQTWQVPTLADYSAWARSGDESFSQDERLSLLPDSWIDSWQVNRHVAFNDLSSDELEAFYSRLETWFHAHMKLTGLMHEAGVGFLAGTDSAAWNFQVPGATLHDELALFVEAGLSPLEALRTATINVAEYLQIENYDGTVSVGQEADFLLLDADPLMDVRNISRIFGVVSDGIYIDREEIEHLRSTAADGYSAE